MKKFYMVVGNIDLSVVCQRYETKSDAMDRAERLCEEKNNPFIVLEANKPPR